MNKQQLKCVAMSLVLSLSMSSCAIKQYKAGRKQAPGVSYKGDLNVTGYWQNKGPHPDVFVAYSPINQMSVFAGTNTNNLELEYWFYSFYGLGENVYRSNFYELGAGWYKRNEKSLIEIYGFGGLGRIHHLKDKHRPLPQYKYGLSLGLSHIENDFSMGAHLGLTHHRFKLVDEYVDIYEASELSNTFLEGSLVTAYTFDQIMTLEMQFGLTESILKETPYYYQRINFSLGARLELDKVVGKKARKRSIEETSLY